VAVREEHGRAAVPPDDPRRAPGGHVDLHQSDVAEPQERARALQRARADLPRSPAAEHQQPRPKAGARRTALVGTRDPRGVAGRGGRDNGDGTGRGRGSDCLPTRATGGKPLPRRGNGGDEVHVSN
jgi:hypothetical protein